MFIKEIIVDGFKSYANRTVISGWDPLFNAITGLNGSGKSNILDSICFVLGIRNLSQVRVHDLQELVYKQGQSHVTKASVTLVFDNSDRKLSPVGYEHCEEITVTRQVVIGGRGKYLINGHAAQQARVQNLFHSVQLNVNNPHFLIMQGRITKVCNMKPPEILGMIEEAAGTRMYEDKKTAALKTIAKKQAKVDEITNILDKEINPTIERLKKERTSYMQWSNNNTEIERLARYCTAAAFVRAEEVMRTSKDIVKEQDEKQLALTDAEKEWRQEIKTIESEVSRISAERDEEMTGSFKALEARVNEESKAVVKDTSVYQHAKDNLEAEERNKKDLLKSIKDTEKQLAAKEAEVKAHADEISASQQEHAALVDQIALLESQQLGFSTANNGKESGSGTLPSQLMEAQRVAADRQSEMQSLELKIKHVSGNLKQKEKAATSDQQEYAALKKKIEEKQTQLAAVEKALKQLNFQPGDKSELEAKIASLKDTVASLKDDADSLKASLQQFEFDYSPPSGNFDRNRVKGMVAKLFRVKDSKTATALEVAAGGKLYQVVVDSQDTAKQLIEKGKLKKRVTIIPLNKIAAKSLPPQAIEKAHALVGADKAVVALTLVGYQDEIEAAMSFVFGTTFICPDPDTARAVAFDPQIKARCVTLEGDLYDPAGTLTGGSKPAGGAVLLKLDRLNTLQDKLEFSLATLKQLEAQLASHVSVEARAQKQVEQRELLAHSIKLDTERLGQSAYAQLQQEVEELKKQLATAQEQRQAAQEQHAAAVKKCGELERQIKDFESERKNKAKEIEKDLAACKKKVSAASAGVKKQQQHHEKLLLELEALKEEMKSLVEQRDKLDATMAAMAKEIEKASEVMTGRKASFEKLQAQLDKEKERIAATDKQLSQLNKQKAALSKAISENALELKKITNKIAQCQQEEKECSAMVQRMLKEHEWIASERHLFGKAHTDYDFAANNPKTAETRLAKLKEEQEKLSRKINKKVMGMFEKAEQECEELKRKKTIIETDKSKIEQVIAELDRKKNEALESTWKKVTKDFGSIFSTLLPGTMAKLEPSEGKSVLDGLELRVAFHGIWKESLSELSGGQRSLLALSLILALLLFKPAPMYILDEVDAALDLSHTQNIGTMLKTHFPQSQFIVVSLKEGMFNNANVVFRTKFVDGVSTVTRTQLRVLDAPAAKAASGKVAGKKRSAAADGDKENVHA